MRIGIDLGGTKIEGVALAGNGRQLARRRILTPRHDYDATLEAIAGLVGALEDEAGERGTVGVGMPGAVSPVTGQVKNANSTWLIGRAFDRDLAEVLGRSVRWANDANCLALSEAVDGAAAGARIVFGVILGTGTGGGLAVEGRVHHGRNHVAGEWGHNPLPWPREDELPGPLCYCGKRGCLEMWLSGPALAREHRESGGGDLRGPEIVAAAEAGDRVAAATLRRYEERLARGLAGVVNVLDPDVIVLGGGLSNVASLPDAVAAQLSRWVFGGEADTPVRRALHGDASGVRGAAWLWGPEG